MWFNPAITPRKVPPLARVDHRIAGRQIDVAGHDDVRAPEEDDGVAVGDRGRLMKELDRLAVRRTRPWIRPSRCRSARPRPASRPAARSARSPRAAPPRAPSPSRRAPRCRRPASFAAPAGAGERRVAAHAIGSRVGVEDEANRLVADSCRTAAITLSVSIAGARVHQQHAVVSDLHRHVAARAGQQVDVALDRHDANVADRRVRRRRAPWFSLRGGAWAARLQPIGFGRRSLLQRRRVLGIRGLGAAAGRLRAARRSWSRTPECARYRSADGAGRSRSTPRAARRPSAAARRIPTRSRLPSGSARSSSCE